jgi:hypothetical protein
MQVSLAFSCLLCKSTRNRCFVCCSNQLDISRTVLSLKVHLYHLDTGSPSILTTAFLFAVIKIERLVTDLCILTGCLARDSTIFHPSIDLSSLVFSERAPNRGCCFFTATYRARQERSTFYPSDVLRPASVGMP